jgi:hypothetical protein
LFLLSSTLPQHPFAFVAELMSTFPGPWFMCGGWAVDTWLGRVTRSHADIDVSVFAGDQRALFDHLAGWNLVAHDATDARGAVVSEPWKGRSLTLPAHLHARPPGDENAALVLAWVTPPYRQAGDGSDFDFVFNERSGDEFVLEPGPRITRPLDECIRASPVGVPMAAPEVLMYFKATAYRDHAGYPRARDLDDFLALLPLLGQTERTWLAGAIATVVPGHDWLEHL